MTTPRQRAEEALSVEDVLAGHQRGFMGTCVSDKGDPCGWRPRGDRLTLGAQHRRHLAGLLIDLPHERGA